MNDMIAEPVLTVLHQSRIVGARLYLPPTQLDRKLYVSVNEVIARMGGKWQGGKIKAHVFEDAESAALLREVLSTGIMPPKNPFAYWPTPANVIQRMLSLAPAAPHTVLEPSAGEGAIVGAALGRWPACRVLAIELDPRRATKIGTHERLETHCADFLTLAPEPRFDAVLMNPPFAVAGDALAYITHIRRAFDWLTPGGVLVAIAPAGLEFRTDRRTSEFREFVLEHGDYERLADGTFEVSGTGVATVLVRMQRA